MVYYNKPATVSVLKNLLEEPTIAELLGRNGYTHSLQSAIYHLSPKFTAKSKSPEAWCAKATSKDSFRLYLKKLVVQKQGCSNWLIGCDSYRLHIHKNTALNIGYYDPKTAQPVEEDCIYPDITRVLPSENLEKSVISLSYIRETLDSIEDKKDKKLSIGLQVETGLEAYFNAHFLNDAMLILSLSKTSVVAFYHPKAMCITFTSLCGEYYALVSAMRRPKQEKKGA